MTVNNPNVGQTIAQQVDSKVDIDRFLPIKRWPVIRFLFERAFSIEIKSGEQRLSSDVALGFDSGVLWNAHKAVDLEDVFLVPGNFVRLTFADGASIQFTSTVGNAVLNITTTPAREIDEDEQDAADYKAEKEATA
jgi:hypothetical protein